MLFDVKKKIKKQNKTKYGFVKTKTNCSFWDVALVLISVIRKLLRVNSIWSMWKMLMSMITWKKMSDFFEEVPLLETGDELFSFTWKCDHRVYAFDTVYSLSWCIYWNIGILTKGAVIIVSLWLDKETWTLTQLLHARALTLTSQTKALADQSGVASLLTHARVH